MHFAVERSDAAPAGQRREKLRLCKVVLEWCVSEHRPYLIRICLILLGKEFVECGLSKYAPLGSARPTQWGLLVLGLVTLFAGATVIRPYWWCELSRRRHGKK